MCVYTAKCYSSTHSCENVKCWKLSFKKYKNYINLISDYSEKFLHLNQYLFMKHGWCFFCCC
uniref:Uncharacterized protein n=1 Tax=Anguilla anguilla TaxID=7936 RepID=A0A0E9WKQ6_ANGAN